MNTFGKIVSAIVLVILVWAIADLISEQGTARYYGGETTIDLEPNQKLVEITWKNSSLWYLTRPMRDDEEAEIYTFQEKDSLGIAEGTVTVKEYKLSEEEYNVWLEQENLKNDYYLYGNTKYSEDGTPSEVYIVYDESTDTYTKIRDYSVNEYGELVPSH